MLRILASTGGLCRQLDVKKDFFEPFRTNWRAFELRTLVSCLKLVKASMWMMKMMMMLSEAPPTISAKSIDFDRFDLCSISIWVRVTFRKKKSVRSCSRFDSRFYANWIGLSESRFGFKSIYSAANWQFDFRFGESQSYLKTINWASSFVDILFRYPLQYPLRCPGKITHTL